MGSFAVVTGYNHPWNQTQSSQANHGITLWAATSDGNTVVVVLTQLAGINDLKTLVSVLNHGIGLLTEGHSFYYNTKH